MAVKKISFRQKILLKEKIRTDFLKKRLEKVNIEKIQSITFIKQNGDKIRQNINSQFLKTEKGTFKSKNQLIKDISAIAHDIRANHIKI